MSEKSKSVERVPVKGFAEESLSKVKANPWIAVSVVLAIVIVGMFIWGGSSGTSGKLSDNVIGEKALSFFNTKMSQTPGTLDSIEEKSGVYEVKISIDGKSYPFYFTQDGNFVYQGGGLISIVNGSADDAGAAEAPVEVSKSDKPVVELFVWSFCPGGVYGESVVKPVVDLLNSSIDARIRFIGPVTTDKSRAAQGCFAGQGKSTDEAANECCINYTYQNQVYYSCALHNSKDNLLESVESERQACVYKNYGTAKLMDYQVEFNNKCISLRGNASAFNDCAKSAIASISGSSSLIATCMASKEGLKILIEDSVYGESLGGISASPSYFVNKVQVSPSSADNLKQQVCSGFNNAPSACTGAVVAAEAPASTGETPSCG